MAYLADRAYPAVVKLDQGSSGSGVWRVEDRIEAQALARWAFGRGLAYRGAHPHERQRGHLIVQDLVPRAREIRIIRIGSHWAGMEKLRAGGWRHSGSGVVDIERPALEFFDLAASICDRFGFRCMALDLLVDPEGNPAILELQTWFGSYSATQMTQDGVPGTLVRRGGGWEFVPGIRNVHRGWTQRLLAFDEWLAGLPDTDESPT